MHAQDATIDIVHYIQQINKVHHTQCLLMPPSIKYS